MATGNWGCGAFRGDPSLKSLIQLMACSAARRHMVYYTFGDTDLEKTLYNLYVFIGNHNVTISEFKIIKIKLILIYFYFKANYGEFYADSSCQTATKTTLFHTYNKPTSIYIINQLLRNFSLQILRIIPRIPMQRNRLLLLRIPTNRRVKTIK